MSEDTQAPERIWFLWAQSAPNGRVFASKIDHSEEGYPEYVRADIHAAALAERDALREEALDWRAQVGELADKVKALEAELSHREKACAEWAEVSQRNYNQAKEFRQAIVHAKTELAQSAQDVHAIRAEAALHRALQKDAGT